MLLASVPEDMFGPVDTGTTAWILISAALVLLMTPALAFFYGGLSRQKSVLNMMMMSVGSLGVVSVVYVLWGYSMSFSGEGNYLGLFDNPFTYFGLSALTEVGGTDDEPLYALAFGADSGLPAIAFAGFQLTFAVITVALISGALAERVKFGTWLAFTAIWTTLVYLPLAHMVWGGGLLSHDEDGLAAMIFGVNEEGTAEVGPIDFAGGTVVHINAGIAALVLAIVVGKRVGFGKTAYRPHNIPFVMLGAALLWFGWFGFNAGSAGTANMTAGLAWVNTTAATAAAMLAWLAVEKFRDGHATTVGAASGVVAGLVAITPACANVNPVGAVILGVVAGAAAAFAVGLKSRFGFDDSLDVVGVHLVAGLIGTVALGFLATETGLFYGGDYRQLVIQIVIALVAMVYTAILTVIIAFALKPLGWRVDKEAEEDGIDNSEHAETAYDIV